MKQYVGLTGGWHEFSRVEFWQSILHFIILHVLRSSMLEFRKLRVRLGGVSFFVASIHLPSCSLRNMISFVHGHVYELVDHFLENLHGFLNSYSRSSLFFVLNFTPSITLMSKVCCIFHIFSMSHLPNQDEHSCLRCVPSTT